MQQELKQKDFKNAGVSQKMQEQERVAAANASKVVISNQAMLNKIISLAAMFKQDDLKKLVGQNWRLAIPIAQAAAIAIQNTLAPTLGSALLTALAFCGNDFNVSSRTVQTLAQAYEKAMRKLNLQHIQLLANQQTYVRNFPLGTAKVKTLFQDDGDLFAPGFMPYAISIQSIIQAVNQKTRQQKADILASLLNAVKRGPNKMFVNQDGKYKKGAANVAIPGLRLLYKALKNFQGQIRQVQGKAVANAIRLQYKQAKQYLSTEKQTLKGVTLNGQKKGMGYFNPPSISINPQSKIRYDKLIKGIQDQDNAGYNAIPGAVYNLTTKRWQLPKGFKPPKNPQINQNTVKRAQRIALQRMSITNAYNSFLPLMTYINKRAVYSGFQALGPITQGGLPIYFARYIDKKGKMKTMGNPLHALYDRTNYSQVAQHKAAVAAYRWNQFAKSAQSLYKHLDKQDQWQSKWKPKLLKDYNRQNLARKQMRRIISQIAQGTFKPYNQGTNEQKVKIVEGLNKWSYVDTTNAVSVVARRVIDQKGNSLNPLQLAYWQKMLNMQNVLQMTKTKFDYAIGKMPIVQTPQLKQQLKRIKTQNLATKIEKPTGYYVKANRVFGPRIVDAQNIIKRADGKYQIISKKRRLNQDISAPTIQEQAQEQGMAIQ